MRLLLCLVILTVNIGTIGAKTPANSPLAPYSAEWNDPKYRACNTAEHAQYLNETEKQIVYVLNMIRMNPQLFCKTVLPRANSISQFISLSSGYYKSLVKEMSAMQPLGLLRPDSLCFISASCHAITAGRKGYVGHERQTAECRRKQHFYGECCQFGVSDPLGIVLVLLVDQDNQSLGHRRICFDKEYTKMSPAIAPHKEYGVMTVMDFY